MPRRKAQPKPRAGSKIMKNPKSPLTSKWTPAHVRKLPSGDIQVKIPLGKAVKSVAVVAKRAVKKTARKVARKAVRRVARKITRKTARVRKPVGRVSRKNPGESGTWGSVWRLGRAYAMKGGSKPSEFWPKMVKAKGISTRYKKDFMNGYTAGKAFQR